MGTMSKLDRTGHGQVADWGADAESRTVGETAFKRLAAEGFTMFDVTDPLAGEKLEAFRPEAGEIIAVPRMKGG